VGNRQCGPDGHVTQITSEGITETIHWDGDIPLFVTDSTGQLDQAMIGRAAWFVPHSQFFDAFDRDYAGYVVAHHGAFPSPGGAVGFSSWVPPDPYGGAICGRLRVYTPPSSVTYSTGYNVLYTPITEEMPVGFPDGVNQFQGVRSYDSQPGTWTSRDKASGSLDDPMSQSGYTYSGGNPLSNVDPTGLDSTCVGGESHHHSA
jgi:RHS repeat-associated protein